MRRRFKSVFDAWVTTILGLVTMAITLILVWQRVFDFVWEGIGGLTIGVILVLAPRTIERILVRGIDAWGKKNNSWGTDTYIDSADYVDGDKHYIEEDKKGDI